MRALLLLVLMYLPGLPVRAEALPAEVSLGTGETVLLMADIQRAALGNGKVVSLATPEKGQLLLFGESPGKTTAQLWLKDGSRHLLHIEVHEADPGRRLREIRELLSGIESVSARVSGRYIVLEGTRVSAEDQERIAGIAALFPGEVLNFVGRADWETMIQMDVHLVEVRRDALQRLGLRWDSEAQGPSVSITAGGGKGLSITAALSSELRSRIDLLQQSGMAQTVAEPTLSCRSGGVARFVSGGAVPIPVTDGLGSTDVQYKDYGVILEVRPRADDSGAIYADVEIELSQIDAAVRVGDYPGFLKRSTSTAINAQEGQTIAIAGMLLREQGSDRGGIPGLSAVPAIGGLFRSTRNARRETELLVLITPRRFDGGLPAVEAMPGQAELIERERVMHQEALGR